MDRNANIGLVISVCPNPNVVAYRPLLVERRSWAADFAPPPIFFAHRSIAAELKPNPNFIPILNCRP